jgi:preprotein translocase subunit SecD
MTMIRALLIIAICFTFSGCKSIGRLYAGKATVFTIKIDTERSDKDALVEQAAKVIANRGTSFNLDLDVTRSADAADQLIVKYFGSRPAASVEEMLFKAYQLELKEVAKTGTRPTVYPTAEAANAILKNDQEALPVQKGRGNDAGFLIVEKAPVLDGSDVKRASVFGVAGDLPSIMLVLQPGGAAKFSDWSGRNVGNFIAIVLNGNVLEFPIIKGQMSDQAMIEGNFTKQEAEDLVLALNAGYLPATMTVISATGGN